MFSGSMVALVTPFKDGGVDWKSLDGLIDFHLQNGTHGIAAPDGAGGVELTGALRHHG